MRRWKDGWLPLRWIIHVASERCIRLGPERREGKKRSTMLPDILPIFVWQHFHLLLARVLACLIIYSSLISAKCGLLKQLDSSSQYRPESRAVRIKKINSLFPFFVLFTPSATFVVRRALLAFRVQENSTRPIDRSIDRSIAGSQTETIRSFVPKW